MPDRKPYVKPTPPSFNYTAITMIINHVNRYHVSPYLNLAAQNYWPTNVYRAWKESQLHANSH